MNNKMKKLIATISLGLMVIVGVGAATQVAKASNTNTATVQSEVSDFNLTLFDNYERAFEMSQADWTAELVRNGSISEEEGNLQIAYYNATTEEDKQKAYENFIDYLVSKGEMTQEEGAFSKSLRHDEDHPDDFSFEFGGIED